MRIAAWVVTIVLLVAGAAIFLEALTTTHSVWLSIPLLLLSGVFTGPAVIALLALCGLYDLAIELNGHRLEFRRRAAD
jgi:putative exporter of polyketide antibiotics